MTLREMRTRMSGEEYRDWVRYYNTEPFGHPRTESRHADVMTSMWALHGGQSAKAEYRSEKHWTYAPPPSPDVEMDPDDEAAMMLARMNG